MDDNRTEVLLDNFQKVIDMRVNELSRSKEPAKKPSIEIQKLETEIKEIEQQIERERKVRDQPSKYNLDTIRKSIRNKEAELEKLEEELDKEMKANGGSQSRILNEEIE